MNKLNLFLVVVLLANLFILGYVFIGLNNNQQESNAASLSPQNNSILSSNFSNNIIPLSVEIADHFSESQKLHWTHMPIRYKLDRSKCLSEKSKAITSAINEIESETNRSVYFIEVMGSEKADIEINCIQGTSEESSFEVEELGEASYFSDGNKITSAKITFYNFQGSCGYFPLVEVHELLHVFGYEHSDDPMSVMYPDVSGCLQRYENQDIYGKPRIDDDIIEDLKITYSKN